MAFASPIDAELARRKRVTDHREFEMQPTGLPRVTLGCGVSRGAFFRAEIAIELAE